MRVTVHAFAELAEAQVQCWNELLMNATAYTSPFFSHRFCRAVNEARGGVRVLQFQENGATLGFLPFQTRAGRTLLGLGEKVGGSLSDYFGAIGNIGTRLTAEQLLSPAKLSSLRFDHAVADMCPFSTGESEEMSGVRVWAEDFSQYRESLRAADPHFVKTVDRSERRLAAEIGEISFSWQARHPVEELKRLIAMKREQYRRTGVADGFAAAWRRAVLLRLVQEGGATDCRPILSTLYSGEKWIAANLSLACGNVLHIWFPAYDPEYRRFGPGHILFFRLIELGISHGFRVFDFGQGESDYKKRYRGETYTLWKGAIRRNSISGYSDRLLQSCEWRMNRLASSWRQARSHAAKSAQ